jgi:hypothetical protein
MKRSGDNTSLAIAQRDNAFRRRRMPLLTVEAAVVPDHWTMRILNSPSTFFVEKMT